jgi:hypothetical protein
MISGYGQPARFAVMPAIPERFRHGSAARAALRGAWCLDLHPKPGSLCRFPEQDEDECAPGRIQDRLGEHAPRQALDVQVFDRNQSVAVDQTAGDFVMKISPLVPHMDMRPLQRLHRLGPKLAKLPQGAISFQLLVFSIILLLLLSGMQCSMEQRRAMV